MSIRPAGSRLTEALRDEYSHSFILNHVNWPHESGDVTTQSYNCMLALTSLQQVSDGIIISGNDHLRRICTKQLQIARPSFAQMNQVAAQDFAATLHVPSEVSKRMLQHSVMHLCSHPCFKLLNTASAPRMPAASVEFCSDTWSSVVSELSRASESPSHPVHTLALHAVLHGAGATEASIQDDLCRSLVHQGQYVDWWGSEQISCHASDRQWSKAHSSFAARLCNSSTHLPILDQVAQCANELLVAKAYVHQYDKYGVDRDFLQNSLVGLEQIIADYGTCMSPS
eukprot:TRINITY_DN12351_c0_g1_i4.p1 TRINITY_DN12351_c0_g1~~TRINITY_DN12351_c0_g1_i4.p1  ORF type:complete len:284 (-),score=41.84 TRINITY_DN12351_c0_g1_i4:206-1057(-)